MKSSCAPAAAATAAILRVPGIAAGRAAEAVGTAAKEPRPDAPAAARALAHRDARIVLAQELDAEWAVAAWDDGRHANGTALRWEHGRWRPTVSAALRLVPLEPRPGATIARAPTFVAARSRGDAAIRIWLDGRPLSNDGGGISARRTTFYTTLVPRSGRHVVVALALGRTQDMGATARVWTFRVR